MIDSVFPFQIKWRDFTALFVAFIGFLVLAGHLFDIGILTQISAHWVTMKPNTAMAFISAAYVIAHAKDEGHRKKSALFLAAVIISSIFQYLDEALDPQEIMTVGKNAPSILTVANFSIIALWGWTGRFGCALCIMLNSLFALGGYVLEIPLMYYYLEGVSTAMAIHTAILFFALSLCMDVRLIKPGFVLAFIWGLFLASARGLLP